MNPKCIQAVTAAAGRALSAGKIKAIEDGMDAKMRELARRSRQEARANGKPDAWAAMTREQRMVEAARALGEDVAAQASLKEARDTMQVLRTAETEGRIQGHAKLNDLTRSQAWIRDMEQTGTYIEAIRADAIGGLGDMMDAAASRDGSGLLRRLGMTFLDMDNPGMTADVVREVFRNADGHTGNKAAQAGARAWLATIETMRLRFNAAGGDVGKLSYGYLAQAHDAVKVEKAGARAWADKVLPLLDREAYIEADGTLTPEAKLRDMLASAWETVSTGGDNKTAPGAFRGTGARANHGAESRVLHFRDGDAWMAYMHDFGEGSLYDAMMGHVGGMARDIGLVERYGPNPEQLARVQHETAARADNPTGARGGLDHRSFGSTPEARWGLLNGSTSSPYNPTLAAWGSNARNIETAAKLGSAVISSLTDMGTIAQTLHFNRLPYFEYLANLRRGMDKDTRAELQAHGIIGEALADSLNRWAGDNLGHNITGRVAGATMKFSLMNAWTDAHRRAFTMTHMHAWAGKVGTAWDKLSEWDRYLMERKGITADDWGVITQATPSDVQGRSYLTPQAVRDTGADGAQQIATKWGSFLSDEAQFAVLNPDQATRAISTGGLQAGTVPGEAVRAFMQFKSFPTAMISRHWRRLAETPQGLQGAPLGFGATSTAGARTNRVAMFAAMNVSLMLLGAVVMQVKAMMSGKDPMDMNPEDEHGRKFWTKALAQGGGLSFVADALLADPADGNTRTWENKLGLAGPVAGSVGAALDLTVENARQATQGKDTHAGAELVRFVNSHLPGVNLWQVRQVWQREVIDQAQEMMNPGYLSRMQRRAAKDWGTSWWWAPGDRTPSDAPDPSTAWSN